MPDKLQLKKKSFSIFLMERVYYTLKLDKMLPFIISKDLFKSLFKA